MTLMDWAGLEPLRTVDPDPFLDLDSWIGIRTFSFRFELFNGNTSESLGDLTPYITQATLSHNAQQIIKRQLSLNLNVTDTSDINTLTDRIKLSMVSQGVEFPLGRYMFTSGFDNLSTGGTQSSVQLVDEMLIVDQQIISAFTTATSAFVPNDQMVSVLSRLLTDLPVTVSGNIEGSPYLVEGSWTPGTRRGQILSAITPQGDYMSPWFDHNNQMRFIRTVDAANDPLTFDFDINNRVILNSIQHQTNILDAANIFVVVGNGTASTQDTISGTYIVPASAPYSFFNRGFYIPSVVSMAVSTDAQAAAAAKNLAIRNNVVETVTLSTPVDPRHDCHDVVRFDGNNWLEIAWSMDLASGASMQHTLQRAYQ